VLQHAERRIGKERVAGKQQVRLREEKTDAARRVQYLDGSVEM
jgi:hypothetical protein